jgi:hypothetical protein
MGLHGHRATNQIILQAMRRTSEQSALPVTLT